MPTEKAIHYHEGYSTVESIYNDDYKTARLYT